MSITRRIFCAGSAPALLGLARLLDSVQASAAADTPLDSFTAIYANLKAQDHGTSTFRPICDGQTASGARIEIHETQLQPGAEPHPPHRHKHEEFLLLMKGQLEVTIDGVSSTLTPGSVGFWKTMSLHHARNTGTELAQYFIVSVGTDA